jgi:hypothetical protein
MIHARKMGETFGIVFDEFSSRNKPILSCPCGYLKHIQRLDKALLYRSKEELLNLFRHFKTIRSSRSDWTHDRLHSPQEVMPLFQTIFETYKS